MILILDAYNVIHKIASLEKKLDRDLRSARDALCKLCEQTLHSRGDIQKIILVFDGNSAFADLPQDHYPKMKLVFSETGEDADERIVQVLEDLSGRARRYVVSDDNFVRNTARAHQAKGMSVAEFKKLTFPKKVKKRASSDAPLSAEEADEITLAYKRELGLL